MTLFQAWQEMMKATGWEETDDTVAPSACHMLLQESSTIFLVPIEEENLQF